MSLLNVSISTFLENGHFLSSLPSSQIERSGKTSAVTDPFHRMKRKIVEKTFLIKLSISCSTSFIKTWNKCHACFTKL